MSAVLGHVLLRGAYTWIWSRDNMEGGEGGGVTPRGPGRFSLAGRDAANLLVSGAYLYATQRRQLLVAAVGMPLVILGYVRHLLLMIGRFDSVEDWAEHRNYWERRHDPPQSSSLDPRGGADVGVETTTATMRTLFFFGTAHPLAALAVAVEQSCLVLMVIVMVSAMDKLLFLQDAMQALLASRRWWRRNKGTSSKVTNVIRRVYRITRQFDADLGVADEYHIEPPHNWTQELADRVFGMFEEASDEPSKIVMWLGTDLCVCNFQLPLLPEPTVNWTRWMGRVVVPTSATELERICTVMMYPFELNHLHVYVRSAVLRPDTGSVQEGTLRSTPVAESSADAFLGLIALHDGDEHVMPMHRDENFVGRFPVSLRGLHALGKDPNLTSGSNHCHRRRVLNLELIGLDEDQWGCFLRGCTGPGVKLYFNGGRYGERPDAIRALIQAMRENECRARVSVNDVQCLPDGMLGDFAAALERNSSLTELELRISCTEERTGFSDLDAARAAGDTVANTIFDCLSRRSAHLDVLELHLPVASSHMWNRLWDEVVPAAGLNLKGLVLRTGIGRAPRTPRREYVVDNEEEERMIRVVSASTSLCMLDFRDWNMPNNSYYVERIDAAVRPFLDFNRFRRLALLIENEPDVAQQKRWFATTFLRSATCREPSWCYFLLKRNVGLIQECMDVQRSATGVT